MSNNTADAEFVMKHTSLLLYTFFDTNWKLWPKLDGEVELE